MKINKIITSLNDNYWLNVWTLVVLLQTQFNIEISIMSAGKFLKFSFT